MIKICTLYGLVRNDSRVNGLVFIVGLLLFRGRLLVIGCGVLGFGGLMGRWARIGVRGGRGSWIVGGVRGDFLGMVRLVLY
jgi:hypothetical protein